jgi:hypothetical protein
MRTRFPRAWVKSSLGSAAAGVIRAICVFGVVRSSGVRVASARDSVAHRLVGQQVECVTFDGRVRIYDLDNGTLVADHVQLAPGEAAVLDEHYPAPRRTPSSGPRARTDTSGSSLRSVNRRRRLSEPAPRPG